VHWCVPRAAYEMQHATYRMQHATCNVERPQAGETVLRSAGPPHLRRDRSAHIRTPGTDSPLSAAAPWSGLEPSSSEIYVIDFGLAVQLARLKPPQRPEGPGAVPGLCWKFSLSFRARFRGRDAITTPSWFGLAWQGSGDGAVPGASIGRLDSVRHTIVHVDSVAPGPYLPY
jgi:hypothetical protein